MLGIERHDQPVPPVDPFAFAVPPAAPPPRANAQQIHDFFSN